MNNTIQLYTDHTKTVMGYPITTPDRVVDESGGNIEEKINTINEQLDIIEKKILNPEMFRIQNGVKVDDQTAINKAIEFACNTTKELHFYREYAVDKIIINKDLNLYTHGNILRDVSEQEVFFEVNSQATVNIDFLTISLKYSNIGILNNDSSLNIKHLFITGAKTSNVEYKKVGTGGYGEIKLLESQLSKNGLVLNSTDVKVNRYQGFNCLTHIVTNGGGNFINNAHGWNMSDTDDMGDYVTGSTFIDIQGGSIVLNNIYADTVENAIKLPNDSRYTLISITNLVYFLNRTYYPDGINRPNLLKNLNTFNGFLTIQNVQADNSAWRDNNGNQVDLIDSDIDYSRIMINGIGNNGYLDSNFLMPKSGDLWDYITNEKSEYFSPYMRRYNVDKKYIDIKIHCSMTGRIPNEAIAYQVTFNKHPFNKLDSNTMCKAIINENGNFKDLHVQVNDNVLTVTNKTGNMINEGALIIRLHHLDF